MWYQKSVAEVAKALKTDEERGLTSWEHEHRLREIGENRIKEEKKLTPGKLFLAQFCDFMVMVLMAAAAVSAFLGESGDAIMICAIIVVNSILGFVQEYKAEKALTALKKLNEDEARLILDGELKVVKSTALIPGDVVLLEAGTKVPADLRLTRCTRLKIDESLLTGESKPVTKTTEVLSEQNLAAAKRRNMAYGGSVVSEGRGRGIVVATGMGSELGTIAAMLDEKKKEQTPLQKQMKQLGKVLILICALLCGVVAFAGLLGGGDLYTMILTGVSLGVASIPEGLPIIVTVCLALGVRRLASLGAVAKRLPSVETLGCVNCICADKTGTLTKNTMEVREFYLRDGWHSLESLAGENDLIADVAMIIKNCNNVMTQKGRLYGDPTETALLRAMMMIDAPMAEIEKRDEIAFSSERKLMSVFGLYEGRKLSLVKGAPDRVLKRSLKLKGKDGIENMSEGERRRLAAAAAAAANKGYRVLALAMKENADPRTMEEELTFIAFAAISDPLRENAKSALSKAASAGVRSIMITGDQQGTAVAVGRELGLCADEDTVLSGGEMAALSDGELQEKLARTSVIAAVSPADKRRVVSLLKAKGAICAMTGDGVNDAPALKEADIGIAMGKKGTDVTKAAADLILADDDFSVIVEAIKEGRVIYDKIRRCVRYLLSTNLGEILVMLFAVVFSFPLPLLPLQILWINLVTDGLPALALAMEGGGEDLMREKPRNAAEGFFSRSFSFAILKRGFLIGFLCFASFLLCFYLCSDLAASRSVAFNALVVAQLLYVFECRSGDRRFFRPRFFSDPFLRLVFLLSLLFQIGVLYLPRANVFFGTVPLSLSNLLLSLFFAVIPTLFSLIFESILKKN